MRNYGSLNQTAKNGLGEEYSDSGYILMEELLGFVQYYMWDLKKIEKTRITPSSLAWASRRAHCVVVKSIHCAV